MCQEMVFAIINDMECEEYLYALYLNFNIRYNQSEAGHRHVLHVVIYNRSGVPADLELNVWSRKSRRLKSLRQPSVSL